ncbi:hypothetical protein MRAB57_2673 [Mycobacterium rhizamassiliense]|uniref:Uncharacterized protein n=2 Tax=Mycobacterium TaxID=1763 RepID=A0A2U3PA95_9MYCO|nr:MULTISPECIES: hypothetical protein [Mycobacterium]SPM34852.1 hypothetical protein MRAB57_2673 [Mycobacterium rhizamassiliense]SPM40679.1 hypothetical protein MNAB215_2880 [Mycobacterium numidiamassiliense]
MNFADVIAILDDSVGGPDADVASHGPFWRGITRDRFVAMKIGGRPLVILGDGDNSNLVKSLRGQAPFGSDLPEPPVGAVTPAMPAYLPPVTSDSIKRIVQWINDGCREV